MKKTGLYDYFYEHDSCGVGFIASVNGQTSHQLISDGITILKNLVHRGATGGDLKTGDGAGILIQLPHSFLVKEAAKQKFSLPQAGTYGVGMLFLPQNNNLRKKVITLIENIINKEGGGILGWRDVPTCPGCLGRTAMDSMPFICQVFVEFPSLSGMDLERKLYLARRIIENKTSESGITIDNFYIPSFSASTIIYKGLFVAPQFEEFYLDLKDKDFQSTIIIVHQRYSTNTFPSWPLAQPFRYIAHNGEINTLRGNINKMKGREKTISSDLFGEDIKKLLPVINTGLSDSGIFDNVYELLFQSGFSLEHSMMMMVPEAFGSKYHISEDKRAFYEYHSAIMEPWDGPAALVFTDGTKVGAALDRNGLRPARYTITKSGKLIMASEFGVLEIQPEDVLQKGHLSPGKMILVDTSKQRIIYDNEVKSTISRRKPYRRWLEQNRIELKGLFQPPGPVNTEPDFLNYQQKVFRYTLEDINMIITPMAENAQEPVGSMGNDTALAVLSEQPQLLFNYFKQLFAQVTNPPIDPYRENLVMSLMSFIGKERNLLEETPLHCHQLKLQHPILTNEDVDKLRNVEIKDFRTATVPILFNIIENGKDIEKAIESICNEVVNKVDNGSSLIILSDRGVDENNIPVPALLATSAIHHYLVSKGKRQLAGLVVETGEAKEVMHFALLIGFGASAVNPYLAFETVADLKTRNKISEDVKLETAIDNYITAIKKGLLKTMSKMGVSTIRSYRGAQLFEAIGLSPDFVNKYFPGTPSRIGGIGVTHIFEECFMRHRNAFNRNNKVNGLESGGNIHYRRFSEKHIISPEVIILLQKAVRENNYLLYKEYAELINDKTEDLCTLRGLFKFKKREPVPVKEVESSESIIKRFVTSAMSFGSISKEAHETIAIAMNRLGAASNSGEGGEDEERYKTMPNGDISKSMIKQIASARFGVTSNYVVNSRELQIKMAQGAKPGEGGQLPGHKVDINIARVRHSIPGVMLVSPPPHHDIYSIEDLSELIYDLKSANPDVKVSVKLVAEVGVGTIAAGVAKGGADMVLISGHDGGTGASPISSIKHAGIPWEMGLAETQQTLVLNDLRNRIRVQVDGKLHTGRDVVIGALLGADEFGFGTTALITMGCIMMRKCHLNTCPVGVATQDPELRKRFTGKPEYLMNFMRFIANDVREIMAELGFRTFDEMIGQADILEVDKTAGNWKTRELDFSNILIKPITNKKNKLHFMSPNKFNLSNAIDNLLIEKSKNALENKECINMFASIGNSNRAVGSTLSAEVSKRYGSKGMPENTINCKFIGSAGQSFGAFLAPGITFELEGESNDYVGKGLSGGKIVIYPPKNSQFRPQNNIIIGNVCLFGATSGEVYINGMAGERFAVRNSGAVAVVEGIGDHGCEYMTGGVIVILGKTGINFGAGMSGGIAYVLDQDQLFDTKCNLEMIDVEPVLDKTDRMRLYTLISNHVKYTGSEYAERLLKDWTEILPQFVKVMPIDYKRALERIKKSELKDTEVVSLTEEVY
jgi:glutamate synthase domain-containing protein 2/glutamate synthase domain-containing protein 1/glutamate synthase domain-containing protein 3